MLLTTHLLDDAERLADDVAILSGGRVVRHGRLEELTRIDGGDVVEIDFGDAPSEALRRWADDCPEGMRAESPAAGGLVRLTGVSSPSDMRRLAESWSRHRLLPVRFDRVSQRLETVLEEVSR